MAEDDYTLERQRMVIEQIARRGVMNSSILGVMKNVPRHLFVPSEELGWAYADGPLPIGQGQTISQPYIVALMSDLLALKAQARVLEVGTGSGYQAAVLAEIVDTVYTIEILPELAKQATSRLAKMGYKNIITRQGDGYNGWKEHAPFDIIIVTAADDHIPQPLIDQLAENGRLVMPIGSPSSAQQLVIATKKNGKIDKRKLSMVKFVPLLRGDF